MADVALPFSETIGADATYDLGQISNALSVDLTSVAGTHSFSYFHVGSQAWVLLKAYTTTTHETIHNLNGRKVRYVASDTASGTVVDLQEIANIRNS